MGIQFATFLIKMQQFDLYNLQPLDLSQYVVEHSFKACFTKIFTKTQI